MGVFRHSYYFAKKQKIGRGAAHPGCPPPCLERPVSRKPRREDYVGIHQYCDVHFWKIYQFIRKNVK